MQLELVSETSRNKKCVGLLFCAFKNSWANNENMPYVSRYIHEDFWFSFKILIKHVT